MLIVTSFYEPNIVKPSKNFCHNKTTHIKTILKHIGQIESQFNLFTLQINKLTLIPNKNN